MNKKKNSSLMVKRFIIMALLACWAYVSVWSQGTDTSLTLSLRDVTLKELFATIENQSDYTFVYDAADIDTGRKITPCGDKCTNKP